MDLQLMLNPQPTALQLAERRGAILATNGEAFAMYGLRLTAEEAAMIQQAGSAAMESEDLIEFGGGIAPRIIHWFLPSGCFRGDYAGQVAALTEVFYHIKGRLLTICEEAGDTGCMLSDNAVLNYMYRLFTDSSCSGDVDAMAGLADRLLCSGMERLIALRAQQRKAEQQAAGGDPAVRALYADVLRDVHQLSDWEIREEAEQYDQTYRGLLCEDCFGTFASDYDPELGIYLHNTYADVLEEMLRRDPRLLLPSEAQEQEWDSMVEHWEETDAADAKAAPDGSDRKEADAWKK